MNEMNMNLQESPSTAATATPIPPTPPTPPAPEPVSAAKPKRAEFKRTLAVICLAVVLGGSTLGGGLGAGYAVTRHFLPEKTVEEETKPAFSFTGNEPAVIPVNVQVSQFTGIVKSVSESVVSINITATAYGMFNTSREAEGAGSGIIYAIDDEKIYIATNNHVVDNVNTVSISLDDNEKVEAKIVGRDSASDLAMLSVSKADLDALGIPYHAATFGDSSLMEVGNQVVAIGNSMGEGKTATSGIISAINKQITIDGKTLNVLQTDAAINMGNSGGPLVNENGEVIGINTAKLYASGVEGMGYSIPINEAHEILESLRVDGSVKKPYLGILQPRTVDEALMEMFSLPSVGVLVSGVDENGAAYKAGLEPKDLIVGYNGAPITCVEDLLNALSNSKVGDEVMISLYRGGVTAMDLPVVIGDMNE